MHYKCIINECLRQYNTIQIVFTSSTHNNIHLLHTYSIFYTIIDDAGGISSQLDRLSMPPVLFSRHGAGQGTVMMRGGGVRHGSQNIYINKSGEKYIPI